MIGASAPCAPSIPPVMWCCISYTVLLPSLWGCGVTAGFPSLQVRGVTAAYRALLAFLREWGATAAIPVLPHPKAGLSVEMVPASDLAPPPVQGTCMGQRSTPPMAMETRVESLQCGSDGSIIPTDSASTDQEHSSHTHEDHVRVVCSRSAMASLIRSVGGLSKYFYQGLWLADLNADVVGQSINRRGVA